MEWNIRPDHHGGFRVTEVEDKRRGGDLLGALIVLAAAAFIAYLLFQIISELVKEYQSWRQRTRKSKFRDNHAQGKSDCPSNGNLAITSYEGSEFHPARDGQAKIEQDNEQRERRFRERMYKEKRRHEQQELSIIERQLAAGSGGRCGSHRAAQQREWIKLGLFLLAFLAFVLGVGFLL
jgi:hypothetical protein